MNNKTKRIVFDSIAIGIGVLLLGLFFIPFYGSLLSIYQLNLLLGVFPIDPLEPVSILLFIFSLSILFMIILLPILTILNIVMLLCDLNVIKSEKTKRIFKIINTTIVSILFGFTCLFFITSIIICFAENVSINFAFLIFVLIFMVTLLVMIVLSKKIDINEKMNNDLTSNVPKIDNSEIMVNNEKENIKIKEKNENID